MPDFRSAGGPVPIPKGNKIPVSDAIPERNTSISESDSYPESPYVNPFSPGANRWGNMSIPNKSFQLQVDQNEDDLGMDAFNLGDERDLAHRSVVGWLDF
jgi:hypothetical protein